MLETPPSLLKVTVHAKGGASYFAYAVFVLLSALVGQRLMTTIGEPYATAMQQLDRIEATNYLLKGVEKRNLLSLQTGLTKAAELPTFNETLFDEGRTLLRALRTRLDGLVAAVEKAEVRPLADALTTAIDVAADGRPIVDRYHLKTAAKKLQELEKNSSAALAEAGRSAEEGQLHGDLQGLYGRVKEAITLSRGGEKEELEEEPTEKKLPSQWLPSFWACFCAFLLALSTGLYLMCCHWSTLFRSLMYFHPTSSLTPGVTLKVVPVKHRGKPALVPLEISSEGLLFFTYQRQKYEVLPAAAASEGAGRVRMLLCPTELPLAQYAASAGLDRAEVARSFELHGKNTFEIPMPTLWELYKEQLSSPIAIFQLFCCVLWMLDEYWKYTLFTLFMILAFEATTAFSRQKNMQTLRGMSNKAFPLLAYRNGSWGTVSSVDLLPGDLISLKRTPGAETTLVPADCLLLRGSAVVNESTLTGESVPQMKDGVSCGRDAAELSLDSKSEHRVHTLFSGTMLMQHSGAATMAAGAADADADASATSQRNCASVPSPPDGGCLCSVLATAFSSSQGELMRMIEFSTAQVTADKKETIGLLLLLLFFALLSAGYVLKRGLEEGKKSQYELLLRCVLILTSVVPPELPMQTALAVNTALMALMKAQVFCTEPFRVPFAGKITHAFFDKTGTITTDQLITRGVVNAPGRDDALADARSTKPRSLLAINDLSGPMACVIGGCHSLLQVDGKLMGDPIEVTALRSIGWHYNATTSTAAVADRSAERDAAVKQAETALTATKRREGTAQAPTALDLRRAEEAVTSAKASRERAAARRASAPHKGLSVRPVQRHHFSSALQRMSVVALARGLRGEDGRAEDTVLCLVKGSPEAVGALLTLDEASGGKPAWYDQTYRALAEQGLRVLALAYKRCGGEDPASEVAGYAKRPREWVESNLSFAGFIAFGCPVRNDSAHVIRSLRQSSHRTIMLTGDAALTALHVAKEVGMTGDADDPNGKARALLLRHTESGDFEWAPALSATTGAVVTEPIPFSVDGVRKLRADGFDLVVTGKVFDALIQKHPDGWLVAEHVTVFARMSPEGKEEVVRSLRDRGMHTLMCGDGGNDVGALKSADVGISLLSGFGNTNAETKVADKDKDKDKGEDKRGKVTKGGKSAEAELEAQAKEAHLKRAETAKLQQAEFNAKKAELMGKQKQWLEEEIRARAEKGQTGISAQLGATVATSNRLRQELGKEQQALAQKYGLGAGGPEAQLEALDGESVELPMVKLGDASIAAPFTSKLPSIRSCVDIIRQGHCTLVSTVQQQQILMLHCLISAYSLSVLSLEGSRSSESQMIASGLLLSVASFAFSFARPLDRLSSVLPLSSIFHPALILSVLGQLTIHACCMFAAVTRAKQLMGDSAVKEVIAFQRLADKQAEAGDEKAASSHKPNLLNTMVGPSS